MDLDIIIPVLNESAILETHADYYRRLSRCGHLLFVDGGSQDHTVELAGRYGDVLETRRGRARQKNSGADITQNNFLLFLHVDSFIDPKGVRRAMDAMRRGADAGCFRLAIEDRQPIFRFYEWCVNIRARRLKIVDGDLGFFIRRSVFDALDGYDDLPIMDDIVFSKRVRARHRVDVLDHPIRVSSRKWHEQGFARTFGQYTLAYLQLWTGLEFFKHPSEETYELAATSDHRLRPRTSTGPR